jgi:hypothetical protein
LRCATSVRALAAGDGHALFEPFAGSQMCPPHERDEHIDRRIGQCRLQLAQRREQHDPPAGRAHLLESLRRVAHALPGELPARLVASIRGASRYARPTDHRDLFDYFQERGGRDPRLRLA